MNTKKRKEKKRKEKGKKRDRGKGSKRRMPSGNTAKNGFIHSSFLFCFLPAPCFLHWIDCPLKADIFFFTVLSSIVSFQHFVGSKKQEKSNNKKETERRVKRRRKKRETSNEREQLEALETDVQREQRKQLL